MSKNVTMSWMAFLAIFLYGVAFAEDVTVASDAVERIDFGPSAAAGYAEFDVTSIDAEASNAVLRIAYACHPDGLSEKGDFWRKTSARYLGKDVDLPILPANIDRYELYRLDHVGHYRAKLLQGLVRYVRFSLDSKRGCVEVRNFRLVNDKVHSEGERAGWFKCSDERFTQLWEASVRTCELSAIPSYVATHVVPNVTTLPYLADGAKRDRLVWSGDLWFAERSFFYGFRPDAPYLRGSIDLLAANQTPEGYIQACPWPEQPPPGKGDWGPFGSDEFACWFVPVLQDYYLHTADLATVKRHYPKVVSLMRYLAGHQRTDGIFEQRKETCKHAAGLVFGGTSLHHRSYMNILLWKTFADAAYLSEAVGASEGNEWRTAADKLAASIRKSFWNEDKGFFALSAEDVSMGDEANALALAVKFANKVEAARMMPQMRRIKHGKFQQLAARGRFEYGDAKGALAMLEEHNWYKILDKSWMGPRLTYECMILHTNGCGDEAHPDTAVASLYTNYILGIEPVEPGYKTFLFNPVACDFVDKASGEVPTPHGLIRVAWWHENGGVVWDIKAPDGTVCRFPKSRVAAEWITGSYVVPGEDDYAAHFSDAPTPVLKREFTLADKPVKRATWRIASPGAYDASVNGTRVTAVALPIWTAFDRRILEDEYDVTALVKGGTNTLMLELGNGWWNPLPMKMWGRFNLRKTLPHGTPMAKAALDVEYADGTTERIATDHAWQTMEGAVLRNNLYLGETRDARRHVEDHAPCRPARIALDPPKGKVVPRGEMPPIVVYDRWKAKSVTAVKDGRWFVDMGVNFAGTIRATLRGTRDGDVVTFRYGELKHPDGTVNVMTGVCGQQKNATIDPPGIAEQKDTVICPTAERLVYEPRFTFHGFRYVEVEGLRAPPSPEDFEALAWSADVRDSASFECSDAKINLLREVCRRTFRSNLQGVQSDCPARERFGYGGDLAATAESFVLNYDMAAFYRKVVRDRCDMEVLHGVFPTTSPAAFPVPGMQDVKSGKGKLRFGWAVDVPIVIDLLLRYYGDRATMREAYPHLRRFLVNCAEAFDVNHVPPCIGDHEALEKADATMTAQCHYHQFLKLTAKFARLLGETADAERFEATAKALEDVFAAAARYVPAKGFVGSGRQGEECFAIYHGMLPSDDLDAAHVLLRSDVVAHGYALSTGIFSTQYLLEILTARGDAEIAGKVLTHKGFPGWYNMLDNGATTLWETWAQSDNIYSQNHPMFGSCAAWLMRGILGIQIADDAVGCDKVRIAPHPVAGITWAKGHLDTPKGRITLGWKLAGGKMIVEKSIPPGVTVVER